VLKKGVIRMKGQKKFFYKQEKGKKDKGGQCSGTVSQLASQTAAKTEAPKTDKPAESAKSCGC